MRLKRSTNWLCRELCIAALREHSSGNIVLVYTHGTGRRGRLLQSSVPRLCVCVRAASPRYAPPPAENKLKYVTTMVCVAVRGEPVIGVIHQPFEKETGVTYWAWRERGYSKTLQVGRQPQLTSSKLPDPLKVRSRADGPRSNCCGWLRARASANCCVTPRTRHIVRALFTGKFLN